jgi:DNA-binding GntR family transcriptional regulator
MLQANGLVEYKRHHGHVVTRYSIRRAEEVYLLRKTLEPLATKLAAENATDSELRQIREIQEEFRLVVDGDPPHFADVVDLNSRWHRAVYSAAHSALLDEFIDRLWTGVPYQAIWFVQRRHRSVEDHDAVTAALERRDAAAAEQAMCDHIGRGRSATVDHLRAIGAPED